MSDPRGRKWLYGRTIVDGKLRFLSVSQLSKADPEEEGCPRKWYYETVLGRKPPQKKSAARGDNAHDQIAKYLITGTKDLDALVMSGFHMLPKPGPDLLVEHDMVLRPGETEPTTEAEASVALARAPVRCAGIPLLGRMDLTHGRCENQGAENVADAYDPPGTVENCDWKTTSKVEYVKPKIRLLRLIQMAGYGMWSRAVEPDLSSLRLSHGYFLTPGAGGTSRKVSLRVLPEEIDPTWARAESLSRTLQDAARETSPDTVEANTRACRAFGGCFHRDICTAGQREALAGFFGPAAADRMLGRAPTAPPEGQNTMALIDKLRGRAAGVPETPAAPPAAPGAPAPAAPAPAAPSALAGVLKKPTGPTPEEIAAAKAAEIAKIQAEEAEQRGRRVTVDVISKIAAYGLGTPTLGGELARLYVLGKGGEYSTGMGIAGTGDLGSAVNAVKIEELTGLLAELEQAAAAGTIPAPKTVVDEAPPAILSPETPEDAPATPPAAAAPPPAAPAPAPAEPAAEAPKRRGRPPKVAGDAAPQAATVAIHLYINCVVTGIEAVDLWPWVDALLEDARHEIGVEDIRLAPDSSGLGFGKWRGAVAAVARQKELPAGHWQLDTRGSEFGDIVAEALAARARASGGAVVRGIR